MLSNEANDFLYFALTSRVVPKFFITLTPILKLPIHIFNVNKKLDKQCLRI